jgi:uncharacterized protein YbjT (DUF2867 family)
MTILITGANGTVSGTLLRSLSKTADVKLRALVRDVTKAPQLPGVEIAVGDLDEPASLSEAFAGVDTLWLLTAMGPQAPQASSNAVWAARRAGLKHIVRMSAIGAAHDAPTRNGRLHALSDVELQASGIPSTIIRPAFFMQNLLGSIRGGTLYNARGQAGIGMIDVRDIADFGARILTAPQTHAGKTYTITGPASITMPEAASTLTSVLQTPIAVQAISTQVVVNAMIEAGFSPWVSEVSAHEYAEAYATGWGDYTTPDFADVMGRPARSFADFARDHAAHLVAA